MARPYVATITNAKQDHKTAALPKRRISAPPRRARAFASFSKVMEAAQQMFWARQAATARAETTRISRYARQWTDQFHRSLALTSSDVVFAKRCKEAGLSATEVEIVAALMLSRLSMIDSALDDRSDLFNFLGVYGARAVELQLGLSGKGSLYDLGILEPPDAEDEPEYLLVRLDSGFADDVLRNHDSRIAGWPVRAEDELYERLKSLNRAIQDTVQSGSSSYVTRHLRDPLKAMRRITWLWSGLERTLTAHPDWKLGLFLAQENALSIPEKRVLIILIGRELGHLRHGDETCTAEFLTRCAALEDYPIWSTKRMFGPKAAMMRLGLVQPCEGRGCFVGSHEGELNDVIFELTEKSLEMLQLKRRASRTPGTPNALREGRLRLTDLVLSREVTQALNLALVQAKHSNVLMDDWGLADSFPYGRGVTLLLSGPPGTGKTAVSEALAKELSRPLLVAEYAKIQNCFVGQTEKNITKVFSMARRHGAVLFWDEADAMFFDRDSAHYNWEVRDVNVLLQELESFEGVCILATNRKITLDQALERRISLKIDLERPNREMRILLWQRLIPKSMPLADDVAIEILAERELSGGEIKNVILNAARHALQRSRNTQVTMADFRRAISLEVDGRWGRDMQARAGFCVESSGILEGQP